MPEGDTIFRAARTLNAALAGKVVRRFETRLAHLARVDDNTPIAGRIIERVVPIGKHLIIEFSGGLHLRTHLRMNGSWHIYRPGERWMKRRDAMRLVIETDDFVAVGFDIPVAEFLDDRAVVRQEDLRRIGPDTLGERFDVDDVVARMRARDDSEIANVLLNQRVIAGIGNIYKSETLFICRINPFSQVSDLSDETLKTISNTARKILQHSAAVDRPARHHTGSLDSAKNLWVYGRRGEPCRRCGTLIEYRKQGSDVRGTYWCPRCQPALAPEA